MKQLIGHTSPETAFVVDDYPYGFVLRTQIRYWVETKKNFGQRFVSQTLNPKNGKWNKPKAGTYCEVIVMGTVETEGETFGHVTYAARTHYDDADQWADFGNKYQLDEYQRAVVDKVVRIKREYDAKQKALEAAGQPSDYPTVLKAIMLDRIEAAKAEQQAA